MIEKQIANAYKEALSKYDIRINPTFDINLNEECEEYVKIVQLDHESFIDSCRNIYKRVYGERQKILKELL